MIQEVFVPRDDIKDEHSIQRMIYFEYASRNQDWDFENIPSKSSDFLLVLIVIAGYRSH